MKMNGNNMLDKMSDVDPKLIEDADKAVRKKRGLFIGITSGMATVAAAAVITFTALNAPTINPPPVVDPSGSTSSSTSSVSDSQSTVSFAVDSGNSTSSAQSTPPKPPVLDFSKYKDLPKISLSNRGVSGMGGVNFDMFTDKALGEFIEKSAALNAEAAKYGENGIETLPVYMSTSNTPDLEKMKARLLDVAALLGYFESGLEIEMTDLSQDGYRKMLEEMGIPQEEIDAEVELVKKRTAHMATVEAKGDGARFCITTDYTIEITFDEPQTLPDGCSLKDDAPDEEIKAAVDHLYEKYKFLVNYENPVQYGSKILNGVPQLGRMYEYIEFSEYIASDNDQEGKFKSIKICSMDGCELLGDYPVLTTAQAEAILKSDKYSDEDRMPENAEVLRVEIKYGGNAPGVTGILPYYTFYVLTDEKLSNGKAVVYEYTIYAVPEEFIDMDTEDYGVSA